MIVDTTVQEKAIAHPVDSRLLEIARHKVVSAAKRAGINLKQTFVMEGKQLRRKAGGYAHAKQFKRLRKTVKRQRTILGVLMREVQRKLDAQTQAIAGGGRPEREPSGPTALSELQMWLQRAERIRTQQRHDKNKLYALHAPEVECIGKGKARKPYEFGVKVSLAVTHKQGLMVGARSFPGNPFDGHVLSAQLEQTTNLLQDLGRKPTQAIVDLGFRGVDADNPGVRIIHRGKYKTLTNQQRRWLRRRQAIEPMIGHTKSDNRMERCWLRGALGDALHALSCAAGYNIRWLCGPSSVWPPSGFAWPRSAWRCMGESASWSQQLRRNASSRRCARPSASCSRYGRRRQPLPLKLLELGIGICRADYVGDADIANEQLQRALRANPLVPQYGHCLSAPGYAYLVAGRIDEALVTLQKAYVESPTFGIPQDAMVYCYARLGSDTGSPATARPHLSSLRGTPLSGQTLDIPDPRVWGGTA